VRDAQPSGQAYDEAIRFLDDPNPAIHGDPGNAKRAPPPCERNPLEKRVCERLRARTITAGRYVPRPACSTLSTVSGLPCAPRKQQDREVAHRL